MCAASPPTLMDLSVSSAKTKHSSHSLRGQTPPEPWTHLGSSHRTQPCPMGAPPQGLLTSLLVFLFSEEVFMLFLCSARLSMLELR